MVTMAWPEQTCCDGDGERKRERERGKHDVIVKTIVKNNTFKYLQIRQYGKLFLRCQNMGIISWDSMWASHQ